ncbi:MAG: HU family DNA-binding protein [Candidatus Marinimicrobia bacterium]|nr:HU family DNA-binding protein [Candidatus Neomarinimicrobiota bacterium]
MKKDELLKVLADEADVKKVEAEKVLNAFVDTLLSEVKKGEKFAVAGLGTFSVAERAAREGVNPKTGEKIHIGASKNVKFKAAKKLKEAVN